MGLTAGLGSASESKRYLSISNGKFTEKSTSENQNAKQRTKEDGSIVYEIHHPSLCGTLKDVGIKTHEKYGKFLVINLDGGDDGLFQIETKLNNGYSSGFIKSVPNAVLEDLMLLSPIYEEKAEEKKSGLLIRQDFSNERFKSGQMTDKGWLKSYFTKDDPNGLPSWKKVKVNGEDVWDKGEQLEFFETIIGKLSIKLKEINKTPEPQVTDDNGFDKNPFD